MDSVDRITTLASLITALAGFFGSLGILKKARAERRKIGAEREQVEADASERITQAALSLVEPLRERLTALEVENASLRTRITALETENASLRQRLDSVEAENVELAKGIQLLICQIEGLDARPVWAPPRVSNDQLR